MLKLFTAFAIASLLLPGFARAEGSCHHEKTVKAEEATVAPHAHHAGHANADHTGDVEEVPHAALASSSDSVHMKGDCPSSHPGVVHSCSTHLALMKCGMHGCCIKSDIPVADDEASPKVAPEMAINARQELDLFSLKGTESLYLLEKLSNYYPPVPRPPSA